MEWQICNNPTDIIASTDKNYFLNYWNNNVITIGLSTEMSGSPKNNLYEIEADINPQSSCMLPPTATLLKTFALSSSGDYDICDWPLGYYNRFATPTNLYLQLLVNFKNGEYIDQVKCITTNADPNGNDVGYMTIQIRGNVKDYSASVINYEIKVYKD